MTLPPAHFSARQRKLLEKFRSEQRQVATAGRILPKEEHEPAVLSFSQQRLWFLDQLVPNTPLYNVPIAVKLEGDLNVRALEASLGEIIRRHKILRTRYVLADGVPVLTVVNALFEMGFSDLTSPLTSEPLEERINREVNLALDLQQGPILRASLYRLKQDVHVLVLVIHHIAFDGQSVPVLLHELNTLYDAFCDGRPSPLPALPLQYEDFAVWQRKWLQGKVMEEQLNYWLKCLAGAPAVLAMPTDYIADAPMTYRGARLSFALSGPAVQQIARVGQSENASLFITLLASFQLLLHRYSGQSTVITGTPLASRHHREIEGLIGFFGNTLPLRSDLAPGMSFRQLLRQTRAATLDAFANQDLPFERLVQELHLDRDLKQHPVFQAMFSMQNLRGETLAMRNLRVQLMQTESPWAKFALHLALTEQAAGITGSLRYGTDLFSAETISRMLENWQYLLEATVKAPDTPALLLPLVSPAQKQQLVVEWNQTQRPFSKIGWTHELFEQQVELIPRNPAVITENLTLSYQELNLRSNRLAHYLRSLHIGPECRVGVCMERSAEMIIALLAILKAGAAYVPLEPNYPAERLEYMIQDAGVQAVLTQQCFENTVRPFKVPTISVDSVWREIAHFPAQNTAADVTGNNLAYIIYTSGSTGQPKGAMNTHSGIRNRLLWMQEYLPLTSKDRVLQKTPFSFDVSVGEFFWPLLAGAALVMAKPGGHQDSKYLKQLISKERITALHFVPSMLEVFLEEDLETCNCVKYVVCSGEALSWQLKERFLSCMTAELHNLYGPTETSIEVSYWKCECGGEHQSVPIGRPIANIELYVLDEELQPVPQGVAGQLHIGGTGVGRGYWRQPALTAERFIPNPFRNGERLYRTGDLARWLRDGNIEYLGRMDYQVKLRGFRIELGEIEAALLKHPQIRNAVALAREDQPGKKQLVAYVMSTSGEAPSDDELRSFLKQKLPEYMVPALFMFLEQIPLLESGKIDRKALPAPIQSNPAAEFSSPRDAVEVELCNIWREVLGLTEVGIDQNFFTIGGHSLSAIQLVSRIEKRFQQKIPVSALFQFSTVAEMALLLRQKAERQPECSLVAIQASGANPPFFCVHAIGGNVLSYVGLARSLGTDQPFYGLQALGLDGNTPPLTSIPAMASHYLSEIRRVQPNGPYYLGGWSLGGVVAFEIAQELCCQQEEVGLLVLIDSEAPSGDTSGSSLEMTTADVIRALLHNMMIEIDEEKLPGLSEEQQLGMVLEAGKQARRLPADFGLERAWNLLHVFKTNLRARSSYVPQPYPGHILFFRAVRSIKDVPVHLDSRWRELALSGVEVHDIPGNHFTMLLQPDSLKLLANTLKHCLKTSQSLKAESKSRPVLVSAQMASHT